MYRRVTDEVIRLLKIIALYDAKTIPPKLRDDTTPKVVEACKKFMEIGKNFENV